MRNIFRAILVVFTSVFAVAGRLSSLLESAPAYYILNELRVSFYRGLYKGRFKHLGKNCRISHKLKLLGGKYISIGDNFSCLGSLRMGAYDRHNKGFYNPAIAIGDNVSINFFCHISCINKISIGNNVLMASKIFITDHYHGEILTSELQIPPSERALYSSGPVVIEDNVWIGEGVVILPNLTIGENCIIGSNSVVNKSFPKNCVIAGIPARIIKIME